MNTGPLLPVGACGGLKVPELGSKPPSELLPEPSPAELGEF